MAETMLINATQSNELRVAITKEGRLIGLDVEIPGKEQKISNVYKGVITSVEPSLRAVFVKYSEGMRHGFLPLKEISKEYFLKDVDSIHDVDIREILKEDQPLVVQIEKEEHGTKGAALTTFITLPGAFLVLMPNNPNGGGVSRRIDEDERKQLRDTLSQLNVPEGMSVIVRTAGMGKNAKELTWDLETLLRYWNAIKQAATIQQGVYLIHQESNALIRAIRDNIRQEIDEIIVDDSKAYNYCQQYIKQINPDFVEKVKLYQDKTPVFSRFHIEQQAESAFAHKIQLPSGGSIVIDQTEALIAIDINSGRATKGKDIEETAFNTNLEAADEIARQLRIRDSGGLIVIDFIDMVSTRNQREVENRLRNALHYDRARIRLGRISQFGMLEMSRQRIRSSLYRASQIPCPRCNGQGSIRSVESQTLAILRIIQERASQGENLHFTIQLPLEIAAYMTNEKRTAIQEIEAHYRIKISLIPNEYLKSPHYDIHTSQIGNKGETPSYELIQTLQHDKPVSKSTGQWVEPAINQFLSNPENTNRVNNAQAKTGLLKKLWEKLFGKKNVPHSNNTQKPKKKHPYTAHANRRPRYGSQKSRPRNTNNRSGGYEQQARKHTARKRNGQKPRHNHTKPSAAPAGQKRINKEHTPQKHQE